MSISITKEDFKKYKRVQKSGMFNMFDHRAREVAGLSKEQWMIIIMKCTPNKMSLTRNITKLKYKQPMSRE